MPNRLAQAQSLYLRKHADNPVDWWPWCDGAIAQARQGNLPIFLSVGYSSCHWCTVMEGEAFSDPAIAAYLNAHFLPIKVDREERPDLDSIYMQALQMMTGQGGWPLNIFLAPADLVPFYGGTYFPVEPKYGRPGFLQVLQALRRFYDTEPDKLTTVKMEILDTLHRGTTLATRGNFGSDTLVQGWQTSARILSPSDHGNSFPMLPYADWVLRGSRWALGAGELDAAHWSHQRGLDLALGGIFDHVAGGSHRYTVDPTWTVPHFEKMLYDNGQGVEYWANLWSAGYQEPAFERAIAATVQWLQREMTDPAGYFYAAQDADSFTHPQAAEPEEGAFYVWRYETVAALLSPEARADLEAQFTLTPAGNFEGSNVLQRRHGGPLSPGAETSLSQLFALRYGDLPAAVATFPPAVDNHTARQGDWPGRIPPVTDTKMIVAWNSLMISGLARAAVVLAQPRYGAIAQRAAQGILHHQWREPQLYRLSYGGEARVEAQSEDYALLIKALLDLHQADLGAAQAGTVGSVDWLALAQALQRAFDDQLWSPDGGYFNTGARGDLLLQERSYQDNATPAANGIALANLVRLALLTEDLTYLDRAEQGLQAFAQPMEQVPRACPSLFAALDWFRHGTLVRTRTEHLPSLMGQYAPTAVFKVDDTLPADTVGLVCEGLFCKEPARSLEQLQSQLHASQRRSLQQER